MSRLAQNTRLFIKTFAVLTILVVANIVVSQWDVKWDMTESGLYTLTEQSRSVARNVDTKTDLIFFHTDQGQSRVPVKPLWVRTVLKQYTKLSDQISFREVNLNASPSEAREYQVRQNNTVVVQVGEKHKTLAPFDLVNMRRRGENTFNGEKAVTGALKNLTTVTDRTVWFMTGHGEFTAGGGRGRSASSFRNAVADEGFTVEDFNPLNDEFPSPEDLIVVLDPQTAMSSAVLDRVTSWNTDGGDLLIAGNPGNRESLNSLTKPLGVSLDRRQILGQNWQFYYRAQGNPFLLSPQFESHPALNPLREEGLSLLMGRSAPLSVDTGVFNPLLKTSPEAYAKSLKQDQRRLEPQFKPGEDVRGPFTVGAVSANSGEKGKVVVLSDVDLFGNRLFGQAGNKDAVLNLVNWFLDRQISLGIEPTPLESNVVKNITPSQSFTLQIISLIIVPLGVLVWGVVVWWTRKNL